jgi:insecticidal toxin
LESVLSKSHQDVPYVGEYVKFAKLFNLKDLEQALISYKGNPEYDAIFRYYSGCIDLLDSPRMLEPLNLLKQALASLVGPVGRPRRTTESLPTPRPTPDVADIYERLEGFEARLSNGAQQLQAPKTNVPDNLHFVWLGGGIGDIQRDYINIWKQTLAGQGYTLKLWYDSDALLAYETNRIIVEAAKADAMLNGGQASNTAIELGDKYEERVVALKQQMFAHINKTVELGESADNARIDLLVRAYSQDEGRLQVLREKKPPESVVVERGRYCSSRSRHRGDTVVLAGHLRARNKLAWQLCCRLRYCPRRGTVRRRWQLCRR